MRDKPVGQMERRQQHFVGRAFVVEAKASAVVADARDAAAVARPAGRGRGRQCWRTRSHVGGLERVEGQHVLHVGKNQFLMLLFVVQAQLQQGVEGRIVSA
ncbi:hypothetical protein D3C72_938110 [compost metagenome]